MEREYLLCLRKIMLKDLLSSLGKRYSPSKQKITEAGSLSSSSPNEKQGNPVEVKKNLNILLNFFIPLFSFFSHKISSKFLISSQIINNH